MKSLQATDSRTFLVALEAGDLPGLQSVPKSDLHIHSILGARIERIESWIGTSLPRPPSKMYSLDDMINYSHGVLYPHIMTRTGFEFTAESAVQEAIEDGVVRLEMSLDVRFVSLYESVHDGFLSFVARLVEQYRDRIDFRPEIGMSKDRSADDQARLAAICIRSGLFRSIDLYGNETAQPPESYRQLYADARKHGLKLKAHVGEFAGPELIAETLDLLQLDEIQHGIAAATSNPLMARLKRDRIRLTSAPAATSHWAWSATSHITLFAPWSIMAYGSRSTLTIQRFLGRVSRKSICFCIAPD